MAEQAGGENKYETAKRERQKFVDAILNSTANRRIVVAGPGTGKTHLFKLALKDKPNSLTLTFINSLVRDLSLELCGLSDVKTLHGFARSIVAKVNGRAPVYPGLPKVLKEDAEILIEKTCDFEAMLHEMDEQNEAFDFYKQRRQYYGYYGHADLVYSAVKHIGIGDDKIPLFDQIVVDEFQDFNALEVALIDLLARKSPLLVAGDDDQALYDFKKASPTHIRKWHKAEANGYEGFSLPFCSRCTSVIVDATNDIINSAKAAGLLKGRVSKEYKYFADIAKDRDGEAYPKLEYSQWFAKQIPWFITKSLGEIAEKVRGNFSVLVVAPTTNQCRDLEKVLKKKGFTNVSGIGPSANSSEQIFEGIKLLVEDNEDNLGWRLLLKATLNPDRFNEILKETSGDDAKSFFYAINKKERDSIHRLVLTANRLLEGKSPKKEDVEALFEYTEIAPTALGIERLIEKLVDAGAEADASVRSIPITVTTIQRSKGLAADFVFITYFDDQYFIRNKDKTIISDLDVCSFLVALTRARRKAYLVSSRKETPKFLTWIDKSRY